ncbi:unnamed protein product [Lampetra fluviatilis]
MSQAHQQLDRTSRRPDRARGREGCGQIAPGTQEDEAGSEARQLPALVSTRRPPRLGRLASRHYSELAPRQQRQHGD